MHDDGFIDAAELLPLARSRGQAPAWPCSGSSPPTSVTLSRTRRCSSQALNYLGMAATWLASGGSLSGCGRRYLDRTSPALAYLTEGSYPVYILHQTVIVVFAFYPVCILHQTVIVVIAFYLVGMPGPGMGSVARPLGGVGRGHVRPLRGRAPRGSPAPPLRYAEGTFGVAPARRVCYGWSDDNRRPRRQACLM